ncbi:hypothetical protein TNCV_168421 [Trichonephila clavipes]|nr:hypothetical protein TNCV_168421 [Trichonephila clavipes]
MVCCQRTELGQRYCWWKKSYSSFREWKTDETGDSLNSPTDLGDGNQGNVINLRSTPPLSFMHPAVSTEVTFGGTVVCVFGGRVEIKVVAR